MEIATGNRRGGVGKKACSHTWTVDVVELYSMCCKPSLPVLFFYSGVMPWLSKYHIQISLWLLLSSAVISRCESVQLTVLLLLGKVIAALLACLNYMCSLCRVQVASIVCKEKLLWSKDSFATHIIHHIDICETHTFFVSLPCYIWADLNTHQHRQLWF